MKLLEHASAAVNWEISFAQISSGGNKAAFWEKNSRLQFGALVSLILLDGKERVIILGTVTERKIDDLSKGRPSICISTVGDGQPAELLKQLGLNGQLEGHFMVEGSDLLLASYQSTLQALGEMYSSSGLAFSDYLAPLISPPDYNVETPFYTRAPSFSYELKSLLNNPLESLPLEVNSIRSREDTLEVLKNSSRLDETQSVALVSALSSDFSLIQGSLIEIKLQGPPGTGKSYIGVALVEVLLASNAPGPILVIAYTNHALDNFLVDLIDKGIKNLVRIGSRSKKDELEGYNLSSSLF
jgi:hypothetical protein